MTKCKDCHKQATFGYIKPPGYCKFHKKDDMIDVVHKRCKEDGCKSSSQGKTDFCKNRL